MKKLVKESLNEYHSNEWIDELQVYEKYIMDLQKTNSEYDLKISPVKSIVYKDGKNIGEIENPKDLMEIYRFFENTLLSDKNVSQGKL